MARITYLTTIEFGAGAIKELGALVAETGMARPLVVSDQGVAAAGLLEKAAATLPAGAAGFLDVPPNPTEAAVLAALVVYREAGCDGVVAVGGGVIACDADGVVLGAIGVTGDTADNDEVCAIAGIEAAGLTPKG